MGKLAQVHTRHLATREVGYELLGFTVADELFAVELKDVLEIVVPPPVTLVPRAPQAVLGVCSVRGQLVTVLDLRTILGQPPPSEPERCRILLGKMGNDVLGIRVDEIRHVVRLSTQEVELTTHSLGGDTSEAVRGIGRPAGGELIVLLDLATLFQRSRK